MDGGTLCTRGVIVIDARASRQQGARVCPLLDQRDVGSGAARAGNGHGRLLRADGAAWSATTAQD